MPGQIDPGQIIQRQAAKQCHPGIARVVKRNLFFKIQPPFALFRLYSARNSCADMNVWQIQLFGQPGGDMLTSGTAGLFVGLLQCYDIGPRQEFVFRKCAGSRCDISGDSLRARARKVIAKLAQHARRNQPAADGVANIVRGDNEARRSFSFVLQRALISKLDPFVGTC